MTLTTSLIPLELPVGIRSRFLPDVNGLTVHILEAGYEHLGRPLVVLLHGFPELAYSWRKVMPALATAGYHVIAPDQRGYGRTSGWDSRYDGDLGQFRLLNLVRDVVGVVFALGVSEVHAVVGHDFGSRVATWCSLVRPDLFKRAVLMSVPFSGVPYPAATPADGDVNRSDDIDTRLANLKRPRKDYQQYFGTPDANHDLMHHPTGLKRFLRAYYHIKSADHSAEVPTPLNNGSAEEMSRLPLYYVMDLLAGMPDTVLPAAPTQAQVESNNWLTDRELAFCAEEFARTGFQGGLQCYRCVNDPKYKAELQLFSGRTVDIPSMFIAGTQDWGIYKKPGEYERMPTHGCTSMVGGCHLIEGAGHWVNQEKALEVSRLLVDFFASTPSV
jgi:pimeloyl-ACP methyl ester carboxylesterase